MRYLSSFNRLSLLLAIIIITLHKSNAAPCPCDIYKTAGTPCVAAHSLVRALYESYNGPLYQVRRTSDNAVKDIAVNSPGGFANTAVQDSFLNGKPGAISIIYDQTANHNDLAKSPVVHWLSSGGKEASAADGQIKVGGHTVHGISVIGYTSTIAYRNNATKGIATGDQAESMYMVVDGTKSSDQCCFDYGNAETNGNDDGAGTMEAVYWGKDITWGGKGDGNGPWVAADLEDGVYKCDKGGWQSQSISVPNAKSVIAPFATAILKGPSGNHFGLKGGNAQSGKLVTMWDGVRPGKPGYSPKKLQGAIILGTGGDGSDGGTGIFYEGAMTMGNPPDSIDDQIQANIVAAGYGSAIMAVEAHGADNAKTVSLFKADYNPSTARAVISFTTQEAGRVSLTVFDQQGKRIAFIENGSMPAGPHETIWDAHRVPAGVYIANMAIDGRARWAGKIVVEK